jgi:hypothetical protein
MNYANFLGFWIRLKTSGTGFAPKDLLIRSASFLKFTFKTLLKVLPN